MKYLFLFLTVMPAVGLYAQNVVPHKAAKTADVIIHEGRDTVHWKLDPKAPAQEYHLKHPHRNQRVSFITDSDSTSFQSHYGKEFKLVVELPDNVFCFVSIVAKEK